MNVGSQGDLEKFRKLCGK